MRAWIHLLVLAIVLAGCAQAPDRDSSPPRAPVGQGSDAVPVPNATAEAGRWLPPFEGEVAAVSMALLHTGDVVYFSGVEAGPTGPAEVMFFTEGAERAEARVLDLSGAQPLVLEPELPEAMGDLFCSGLTHLPDGRLIVAGGTNYHELPDDEAVPPLDGTVDVRIFDPATRSWSSGPNMTLARWYPSVLLDGNGTAVAASGFGNMVDSETLWREWEKLEGPEWQKVPGIDQTLPLYPRLFTVPGGPFAGDAFYTTAATLWGPSGYHREESGWNNHYTYDLQTGAVHDHGLSTFGARQYASSIMLPLRAENDYAPTFMTFGGTVNRAPIATAFNEVVDLSTPTPTKTQGPDLAHPRWFHNSVLLPDGSFVTIGGGQLDNVVLHGATNPPVMVPERWNPETGTWDEWAPMTVERMYHSSALLLPDGRVLTGGHVPLPQFLETTRETVTPQIIETRLQIFEPPYLFRGERPVIIEGPAAATYGERTAMTIDLPTDADLAHAILVRPGATTHAYDSGQRSIHIAATESNGTVELRMPPNGNVAPPGWYMLFVASTHTAGPVPSEAHWIHLS